MRQTVFLVLFSFLACYSSAQDTTVVDTINGGPVKILVDADTKTEVIPDSMAYLHSPKKAVIMSALLPGLGQIYNKKYWKVPIIYGGFAVTAYYLRDNLQNIDKFKKAYLAETDDNPETTNSTGLSSRQLLDVVEQYKNWRDLSYIVFGAIYVLNIIDANVDAHLFYFDVSKDLSLNLRPYLNIASGSSAGLSLCLKL